MDESSKRAEYDSFVSRFPKRKDVKYEDFTEIMEAFRSASQWVKDLFGYPTFIVDIAIVRVAGHEDSDALVAPTENGLLLTINDRAFRFVPMLSDSLHHPEGLDVSVGNFTYPSSFIQNIEAVAVEETLHYLQYYGLGQAKYPKLGTALDPSSTSQVDYNLQEHELEAHVLTAYYMSVKYGKNELNDLVDYLAQQAKDKGMDIDETIVKMKENFLRLAENLQDAQEK